MKKLLFVTFLLLSLGFVMAQDMSPWQALRHSAVDANGVMQFLFNTDPTETALYQMYHSINNGAWNQTNINSLEAGLMQTQIPYQYGQTLKYRMRAEMSYMDMNSVYLNPAFMDSDSFPPALGNMAFVSVDAIGDSIMISHPALDLTNTHFAWSNAKLYVSIDNVQGAYPTMNSLTSYNLYLCTLASPESAMSDSVMYAMVYSFNIPGVISSGLYKIGVDAEMNPTFERLGNIQSQVVGGKLMMACNIADLTNDPGFGSWPPAYNSLLFTAITLRINLDLSTMTPEFLPGDYTDPAILEFVDRRFFATANSLPVLSGQNLTNLDIFKSVEVTYTDINGDFPLVAELELNTGSIYSMTNTAYNFSDGVTFSAMVPKSVDWAYGYLKFSDNGIDNVQVTVYNATNVEDPNGSPMALLCKMSNPFVKGSTISLSGLQKSPVEIELYNVKGQKLGTLMNTYANSLDLQFEWNGRINGSSLAAGVYYLKIKQDQHSSSKKFVIYR